MNRTFRTTDYVRIFDPLPQHEFVVEHEQMIKELRTRLLKRRSIPELMIALSGLCELFCDPWSIPGDVARQFEDAFRKIDASFLRDGRDFELGVCAIAAVNQSIASGREIKSWEGWSVSDVLAGCVWSALSFLPICHGTKLEALRRFTIGIARHRVWTTSSAARVRNDVSAAKELGRLGAGRDAYTAAVRAVRELELNAIVDKDEISVLRWVLEGVSGIHNKPLESLSSECRAITAGVEIGALSQVSPTRFHRSHLLCGIVDSDPLPLTDLLVRLGEERGQIAVSLVDNPVFQRAPLLFPLLSAICSGDASGPGADLARPLSEWGSRALLERVLVDIEL